MGAITFSLDHNLVRSLKNALPLTTFVETGTFKGDTIAAMHSFFDSLISIELSDILWLEASNRFNQDKHIKILQGNSADLLGDVSKELSEESILYWLDAHWCVAENTSGEESQCPLIEEIQSISRLNEQSVILIDDARLFLAPPPKPHDIKQWPLFNQVILALYALSSSHEIIIVNDVIIFHPTSIRHEIENYARQNGVDWLHASQSLLENQSLRGELELKEHVIQDLINQVEIKEQIIKDQKTIRKSLMNILLALPGMTYFNRTVRK